MLKKVITTILFISLLCVLFANFAEAQQRGYISRKCGFDMDDDFIYGEPADCNVCDGVTTNVDNDAATEQQVYVDCQDGNDASGDGSPGTPYKTIQKAMTIAAGHADDSTESIICAKGTCSSTYGSAIDNQDILESGAVDGVWYKEKAPSGSEEYAFRYPKNPFMVVGWDTDNDGCYPPFDDGSTAAQAAGCGAAQPKPLVFDACPTTGCSTTVAAKLKGWTPNTAKNYVELAHFTMQNYGSWTQSGTVGAGFINFNSASGSRTGAYYHDIILKNGNINKKGMTSTSGAGAEVVSVRLVQSNTDYMSVENVLLDTYSSWPMRGHTMGQHFRLKNWEARTAVPLTDASGTYLQMPYTRIWIPDGYVEMLDSKMDSNYNYDVTQPYNSAGFSISTTQYQVMRNLETVNAVPSFDILCRTTTTSYDCNAILDKLIATVTKELPVQQKVIMVETSSANGEERGNACVGGVCENNSSITCSGSDYTNCVNGDTTANDRSCSRNPNWHDITIKNSVFNIINGTSVSSIIEYDSGSNCTGSNFGQTLIQNNTFNGNISGTYGLIRLGTAWRSMWYDWKYIPNNIEISNNIFNGMNADRLVQVDFLGQDNYAPLAGRTPTNYIAKNNVYNTVSPTFRWGANTQSSYSAWATASGETNMITNCVPSYTSDGYHLASGSCPANVGNNDSCPSDDIDGGTRAKTVGDRCDVGADEVGFVNPSTTTTTVLLLQPPQPLPQPQPYFWTSL